MFYIYIGIVIVLLIYQICLDFKVSEFKKEVKYQISYLKHTQTVLIDGISNNYDYLAKEINKKVSADDIVRMIDEVLKEDKRISKKGKVRIKKSIKKENK